MLFLLKLTITPVLVALMSLAARRWGPTVGGLVMGLPWMTGPILLFLGLEHGETYVARASTGVLTGVIAIGAYLLAYVYAGRRAPWPIALGAAFVAFAVIGYTVGSLALKLWLAALGGAAALCIAYLALPRVTDAQPLRYIPWWDIPMRMLATAALVAVITVASDLLGAEFSGVVATYPVILSVVGTFTHAQLGWHSVVQLARGVSLSLLSFVMFFLVLGSSVEAIGLAWSFLLATAAATVMSSATVLSNGLRRRGQSAQNTQAG